MVWLGPSANVADGSGLHRPGPRYIADAALRDAKQQALDEYQRDIENAWRGDAKETWGEVGDQCTVREGGRDEGSPGHLRRIGNRLVCVPDKPSKDELPTMDERAAAYQAYDEEVSNRWRGADR